MRVISRAISFHTNSAVLLVSVMDNDWEAFLSNATASCNIGPSAKEMLLSQAESDYNCGNALHSVFYQVRALYQSMQERYNQIEAEGRDDTDAGGAFNFRAEMTDWEKNDFNSNCLLKYAIETFNLSEVNLLKEPKSCNFLQNTMDPQDGLQRIEGACKGFPEEWTILQLCKGPRTETTYSTYAQIHEHSAPIYLTILRHTRTLDYPAPICLRFCGPEQSALFTKFACIANRFKECISVDPKTCNTKEAKKKYWEILNELNQYIAGSLADLKNFFYPWKFLFTGRPASHSHPDTLKSLNAVDEFCDEHHWSDRERVLLSLAALHITLLSEFEIIAISKYLAKDEMQQTLTKKILHQLKGGESRAESHVKHYPCILIVDERLDHFFWEELNVEQEFCRVNSLQCLYRLHQVYKSRIHNGYLKVNINNGGCIVNPDNNLPKTELRMRRFLQYWTPHWRLKFTEKPTQDEMITDFFKRPCFVYAGHGSGLQYLNGKHIAKQRIDGVVFLFGCDSSRLYSSGLYSELVGTHLYYHAALCPTLVGTLMPALDANMDTVAAEILSRWIAPNSKHVLPWNAVNMASWVKDGIIKPENKCISTMSPTVATTPMYQSGSLCAILARVHQRISEPKYYNTVPYVCRGLPAWNCDVELLS